MVITNIAKTSSNNRRSSGIRRRFEILKSLEVIFKFNVLIIEPLNNGNISINA